jgi:hypothetical protein
MNRFLYAEANPTTLIDPTGHFVPADDGQCKYKGDPGCGETANCSTCKVDTPTKPKTKPEDNDDSTGGGATSPVWIPNPGKVADDNTLTTPVAPFDLTPRMGGGCVAASASLPLVFAVQGCVIFDPGGLVSGKGTIVTTVTPGTQGSTGIGGSITAGPVVTNARDADDVKGWFVNDGVSAFPNLYGGAAGLAIGRAEDGYLVYVADAGLGRGFVIDKDFRWTAEYHGGATWTEVQTQEFDLAYIPIPGNPWMFVRFWSTVVDALP